MCCEFLFTSNDFFLLWQTLMNVSFDMAGAPRWFSLNPKRHSITPLKNQVLCKRPPSCARSHCFLEWQGACVCVFVCLWMCGRAPCDAWPLQSFSCLCVLCVTALTLKCMFLLVALCLSVRMTCTEFKGLLHNHASSGLQLKYGSLWFVSVVTL